jgi:hypothetical protein
MFGKGWSCLQKKAYQDSLKLAIEFLALVVQTINVGFQCGATPQDAGVLLSIGLLDQKKKMVKVLLINIRIALCNMTHLYI